MGAVNQTGARPYRGVQPADRRAERRGRLLDAGLSILGSASEPEALTVRGLCRHANVSARYFYESFSDRDEFVSAVYDWVIAGLAATIQAAVAAAPEHEQARAAMATVVSAISDDRRVGRLVFGTELADPVVIRKRDEGTLMMAMLLGQHIGEAFHVREDDRVRAASHFAVGGVRQALSAWLAGQVRLTPDELVDQLAWSIDRLRPSR